MPQQFARSIIGKRLPSLFRKYSQTSAVTATHQPSPRLDSPSHYFTSSSTRAIAAVAFTSATSSTAAYNHDLPKFYSHLLPQPIIIHHHLRRWASSSSSSSSFDLEQHKRIILTHALEYVHDDGWTDDAIASGTLAAKLPPSYIGIIGDGLSNNYSSSSPLGNADLVAFFMEECNGTMKRQLAENLEATETQTSTSLSNDEYCKEISSRINNALRQRLSMVLPFVKSNRWHEGMAIGALPQNAMRTIQQLDEMATVVLNYALSSGSKMKGDEKSMNNVAFASRIPMPALRSAIVAAYAATELHLLSDGGHNVTFSTIGGKSAPSLRGDEERYRATWKFLEARSAEVARVIVYDGALSFTSSSSLPHPTHVITAATAVVSSLAGAAISLASPTAAAAVAGRVLPSESTMTSVFTFLENVVSNARQTANMGSTTGSRMRGDGTKPSDYTAESTILPPFDASEEIFSGGIGRKNA